MPAHRIPTIALLAAALLAACADEPAASAPEEPGPPPATVPGTLRAGAAQRPLDIPVGHSHAGYLQSKRLGYRHPKDDPGSPFADIFPASRGIQTPPTAKLVVLDNGVSRLVLARLDVIYMTPELVRRFVELAGEELGEDISGQLVINATHTHGGPCRISAHSLRVDFLYAEPEPSQEALAHGGDTYSQESVDRMARTLVEALREALAGLRPARFGWGKGLNETASRDRRCQDDWLYGADAIDRQVTVLRLEDAESGAPIAAVFHFAMHGTIYGSQNRNLTVDAPGHAELLLEESFDEPVVAMYLQGTAGDVSPNGGPAGHGGSQAMQRVGWDLARTAREVWDSIEPSRTEIPLGALDRWIPVTHASLGYEEGEFFEHGGGLCNQFESECRSSRIDEADLLCLGIGVPGGAKYQTHLTAARIDDLALLTMPGEAVSEVGRQLKAHGAAAGFSETLAVGYAQSHEGYILLEDDWWSGGYEPTISFWGWRFAGFAVEQSGDLLQELVTGVAAKKLPVTMPDLSAHPYEPYAPSSSARAPSIAADAPDRVERLAEVRFSFEGGDPALGNPEVVLEREEGGAFVPVTTRGWLPVTTHRGYQLPLLYEVAPTYKEDPAATVRTHRFEVVYEVPVDLPEGRYRLRATGVARQGGADAPFELASRTFAVSPSTALRVDAAARVEGGAVIVDATLLLPGEPPRWAEDPNDGWQLGRFRMLDPRYPPSFVPAKGPRAVGGATIARDGGAPAALALEVAARPEPGDPDHPTPWAPGQGPGLTGEAPSSGPGTYRIELPAGALADEHGNTSAAASLELVVP